jgi:hypothetical protein
LRKKAGLPKGPVVKVRNGLNIGGYAHATDPQQKEKILQQIRDRTRQWLKFVKESGYPEPLFYGIDEAGGDVLLGQRDAFKAIHEEGGKTAAALGPGFFDLVGEYLDRAIVVKGCGRRELEKVHQAGYKVWIYANPHYGQETPETYRRNMGLSLWKGGYDGHCGWAYQDGRGSCWDDFDSPSRDYLMTYPTIDGIVPTIQWEGLREGVDDVRYLTTLLKFIEKAKAEKKTSLLAVEAKKWLDEEMDVTGDLDRVRQQIIGWIMQLKQTLSK